MKWIVENWFLVVALLAVVAVIIAAIYKFFELPTAKQKAKIKEWLVWACIEAEKALQSGTGQLKLRQVYDMFCSVPAFTGVAKLISFNTFSDWVKDSLAAAKDMIVRNSNLATYVYGDNADEEVEKLRKQLSESNN